MQEHRCDDPFVLTRRRLLKAGSATVASYFLPAGWSLAADDLTGRLATYMVAARDRALPDRVLLDAKQRILDTIASMVSGSALSPGMIATRFIRTQGGVAEASIVASNIRTSAINAAFVNGMLAHADESDDFEPVTKAHPGSATVPAALSMAEKEQRSGAEMIRAVALGYDVGCRFLLALGPDLVRRTHRGAEGYSATMGAMAAAASLARFDEERMRYAISYAAQQVSGLWSWVEDNDHIEKAFDFGGMGARNGVTAAVMVQTGFTGVHDVMGGTHNLIQALSTEPKPEALVADLGSRYFISESGIKTFPVGYLSPAKVDRIIVHLPEDAVGIVSNSPMTDVNCEYLMATALVDGGVSFAHAHSREHMAEPQIRAAMARVKVIGDPKLNDPAAPRGGIVEVVLKDGRTLSRHTRFPPGTKENPLDTETMNAKARDLMVSVFGPEHTEAAIRQLNSLEQASNVRDLVRSVLVV